MGLVQCKVRVTLPTAASIPLRCLDSAFCTLAAPTCPTISSRDVVTLEEGAAAKEQGRRYQTACFCFSQASCSCPTFHRLPLPLALPLCAASALQTIEPGTLHQVAPLIRASLPVAPIVNMTPALPLTVRTYFTSFCSLG